MHLYKLSLVNNIIKFREITKNGTCNREICEGHPRAERLAVPGLIVKAPYSIQAGE